MTPADIQSRLDRMAPRWLGPEWRLGHCERAGGHAGLTYAVTLVRSRSGSRDYMLKLSPPGVRRSGNTDVYRQAALLNELKRQGIKAPAAPFASPTGDDLGTAYLAMERLPGKSWCPWETPPPVPEADRCAMWEHAIDELAQLHAVDWWSALQRWEPARRLQDGLAFWHGLLAKSPDPAWIEAGERAFAALEATLPEPGPIGVVHGDYQLCNILYEGTTVTGIVDWDMAHIGPQLLDVGWLMMTADPRIWAQHPTWAPLSPDEIARRYSGLARHSPQHLGWFHGYAAFRFGVIGGFNTYLHRSGKRVDVAWEDFARCIPALHARAGELAANESRA